MTQQENTGTYYYDLFKFFSEQHNLTLLDSEIQDIIYEVEKFKTNELKEELKSIVEDLDAYMKGGDSKLIKDAYYTAKNSLI